MRQTLVDNRTGKGFPHTPQFSLEPIRYRRMADQIAASIRESIARGHLPSGTHLLEAQIANEMQTSRVPVREALMQLEQEGLVTRHPNRGTFVAELTDEMLCEVASLRGLLEGFAARRALSDLTPHDLVQLEMFVNQMLDSARLGDFSRVVQLDFQFHSYIVGRANHHLLQRLWASMDRKIRVYLSATNLVYGDLHAIVRGHLRILEALRQRDGQHVTKLMEEHIDEVLNVFIHSRSKKARNRSDVT